MVLSSWLHDCTRRRLLVAITVCAMCLCSGPLIAQPPPFKLQPPKRLFPGKTPEEVRKALADQARKRAEAQKNGANKANPENSAPTRTTPPTIRRTDLPGQGQAAPPVTDKAGNVQFAFHGEKWPQVLSWLGKLSRMNVDWQELPADSLNLVTRKSYSPDQARDIINRHLLARGFTILVDGEVMSVVATKEIDSSLVPLVEASQLSQRMAHDFVQVVFPLKEGLANDLAEDFKQILSRNGSLTPLRATNQIQAIDSVTSLLKLQALITGQRSDWATVREFNLKNAKAETVRGRVLRLLGVAIVPRNADGPTVQPSSSAAVQAQLRTHAILQSSQTNVVRILANTQTNSLLVHAPPQKMAVIAKAVEALDIPDNTIFNVNELVGRVHVYRLRAIDPARLSQVLQDVGGLDPSTQLVPDTKNQSLIVKASVADHYMIRSLVEKLDAGSREVHVVELKKLKAKDVAESIQILFNTSKRPLIKAPGVDLRAVSRESARKPRVQVDEARNRLLVWATSEEFLAVEQLLSTLGEDRSGGSSQASNVRTLDILFDTDTEQALRKIKKQWDSISPNPLLLPASKERTSGKPSRRNTRFVAASAGQPQAPTTLASSPKEAPASKAPIRVFRSADGRVVLASQDSQALDILQALLTQLIRRDNSYKTFQPKKASAVSLAARLESFFDESIPSAAVSTNPQAPATPVVSPTLSRISFFTDEPSNTIFVRNASVAQLKTISDLMKIFDVVEEKAKAPPRLTKIIKIRYSRADSVAETLRGAFKDLLGQSNGNPNANPAGFKGMTTSVISKLNASDRESLTSDEEVTFSGKLSIGVDNFSNALLLTCEGKSLMELVEQVVLQLDTESKPDIEDIQVVRSSPGLNGQHIQETLLKMLGKTKPQSKLGRPKATSAPASGSRPASPPVRVRSQPAPIRPLVRPPAVTPK